MQSHSCAQATPWLPSLHGDGSTPLEHPQTPMLGCCGAPGQTLCRDLPRGSLGWLAPGTSRARRPHTLQGGNASGKGNGAAL